MRHLTLIPSWLRFLIVVLLVVGIFFRFFNLGGKVYWHDETYTSLRISGYTATEVKQQIFNGRVIYRESFGRFQRPNLEKGLSDTIKSLAVEEPQHPPLYYIIARLWVGIFGSSVTTIRSLSVFISLLVFPCVYWLCRELFNVPLSVPFLAIALMAISPIHLVYAQEAGEYMLWLVSILLCSAALLRAMGLESKDRNARIFNWVIYAVTLALSLYTFLLSGFVSVAHGIYVITIARFQLTQTVKNYLLASLAGFIAFMPWMLVIIDKFGQFQQSIDGETMQLPLINLIQSWLMQLSRIFFDLNFGFENPVSYLITPIFLIFVGYAIYFLCQTTNIKVWLFIITLIVVPAFPLMLPDLLFGGTRSLAERHLIPAYLGMQLAVAYLLANQLYNGSSSRRIIWQMILAFVIICGLVSYRVSCQADTWWNKAISYNHPQVAKIINQSSRPLVISNSFGTNYGNIFSLSYLVEPNVRFQLFKGEVIPKIADVFTDVFLFNPSDAWRNEIKIKYRFKSHIIYGNDHYLVWKLIKPRVLRRRNIPRQNKLFGG
ncbi:glycosyltransferase family 39 protein [Cylindrospermum sp. FACHB-282]|uniref:glycosyltransferase family 39 protein n=1 Tax=Cylindrospermum sp. FACHB-282 TaxID=2692794 RepID=UPI0016858688|nr:glycosyltransferase family 39 protein [Cylindrospermum sp. FACHB-282]MBD2387501.1 glycosyltransferase family 39 protein [Cylindrospermum sp. FACHB-282]